MKMTKLRLLRAGVGSVILALALHCARGADALATDSPAGAPDVAPIDLAGLGDTEALQFACLVLAPGNHNYNGHRAAAMREIRAAAENLGLSFETKSGKGKEDQAKSDARFTLAIRLLVQVRAHLAAGEQPAALEHVDKALQHLETGLKIRAIEEAAHS